MTTPSFIFLAFKTASIMEGRHNNERMNYHVNR